MLQVLAIKTRELSSVQSDCSARSSQLENKHAQELAAEREKALQVEEFSQSQIIAALQHVLNHFFEKYVGCIV